MSNKRTKAINMASADSAFTVVHDEDPFKTPTKLGTGSAAGATSLVTPTLSAEEKAATEWLRSGR